MIVLGFCFVLLLKVYKWEFCHFCLFIIARLLSWKLIFWSSHNGQFRPLDSWFVFVGSIYTSTNNVQRFRAGPGRHSCLKHPDVSKWILTQSLLQKQIQPAVSLCHLGKYFKEFLHSILLKSDNFSHSKGY